ncbi:MAG: alanine racemase [Geminocystis sp.]|nr:alanine racemase [Geminocystis sp.]MCS7146990.1 alanine racemase [Geminocystis sp.]MCX8077302.1 alanine racemase [Geminocystis sp.]MDW8115814.1 alanine racemase [Geminocystis sp.]MDW8463357.1 alanine racemase [Geminocystis sp.]
MNYCLNRIELQQQRAWITIDHKALRHNVKAIKQWLKPNCRLMAVIKADAYGHGAVKVAETLVDAGVDYLAIATLGEGIELREAGIKKPILILGAINTAAEVKEIIRYNLEPTLCTPQQIPIFADVVNSLNTTLDVHLKLDTGMSRLGTRWENAVEFVRCLLQFPRLRLKSIYSHLATADEPDTTFMKIQQSRFEEAISRIKALGVKIPLLHLANSAGTLADTSLHYDLVRVGLCLYGLYPAPHLKDVIPLKPVLEVKARITQIKHLPPNTGVSYGHTYKCPREIKMAVVAIGYADGVPRLLSNRMKVIVKGRYAPQIGNITMDQLMIDVSDFEDIEVGDIVTLLGREKDAIISADLWANTIGTISWEILCGFKHRLPRIHLY